MPLIAFLLFTHARLQDNACAMSHDSYVGSNLLVLYSGSRVFQLACIMRVAYGNVTNPCARPKFLLATA